MISVEKAVTKCVHSVPSPLPPLCQREANHCETEETMCVRRKYLSSGGRLFWNTFLNKTCSLSLSFFQFCRWASYSLVCECVCLFLVCVLRKITEPLWSCVNVARSVCFLNFCRRCECVRVDKYWIIIGVQSVCLCTNGWVNTWNNSMWLFAIGLFGVSV